MAVSLKRASASGTQRSGFACRAVKSVSCRIDSGLLISPQLQRGLEQTEYDDLRTRIRPRLVSALAAYRVRRRVAAHTARLPRQRIEVYKHQVARYPYTATRAAMIVTGRLFPLRK